ncbi:MAG: M48 family metallopeptidase [Christensenellales bacterium]
MIKPDKIVLGNRKNISLKIDRTGKLIVSAPRNVDLGKVFNFISEKEKWICQKQSQIKGTIELNQNLLNFEEILFLGKKYTVVFIKNQEDIELTDNALCLPSKLNFSEQRLTKALKEFYIKNAEVILINRAKELLKYMNLDCNSISIINSKVKWGMCDSKKNIYLNYKLLFLSHELIDHVIFHELTHLIELNHSSNFYQTLQEVEPNHKAMQQQLKKCGFLLGLLT